jgi:protein-S-isoprenylcysteine O-methyltransferase Ste14
MGETILKERKGEHPFGDAGQLILFVTFSAVWAADSFFLHRSTSLASRVPLFVRLALLALALFGSVSLIRTAGDAVHHGQRPDHVLVGGAFRYVRHPIYLGVLLFYLGLVLATTSLFSLLVFAGIFFFYNYIASYEEKLLEARFGEAYIEYKARIGKWIPRIITNPRRS